MSNNANKYKVGIFVTVGLCLIMLSFLSLGVMQYMTTVNLATEVTQSVQGLDIGARVKYKGVNIGTVTGIRVNNVDGNIVIKMELVPAKMNRDYLNWDALKQDRVFQETIQKRINEGLRCQLQMEGITGKLYVDFIKLSEKEQVKHKARPRPKHLSVKYAYMPSIPRVEFASLFKKFEISLRQISSVDFKKISLDLQVLLQNTNKLVGDDQVTQIIKEVHNTAKNLDKITQSLSSNISKEKVEKISKKLDKAINSITQAADHTSKLTKHLDKTIKDAEIAKTTKSFRDTMDNTDTAVALMRRDLNHTLRNMRGTLQHLQDLIKYMEANPNSILVGKKGKPLMKP
jgi:phospholipid/cholesterol/gamma-HCH transport system substrate-binding protein